MSKYIPPHKRREAENGFKKPFDDDGFKHMMPRYRKTTFSQEPHFNARIETKELKPKEPGPIEIPDIIPPPVVDHPMTEESVEEMPKSNLPTKKWDPSAREIAFFKNMAALRREHARREADEEFLEWEAHYRCELETMYEECVN